MSNTCVYREFHEPTGVTHSVSAYLTHSAAPGHLSTAIGLRHGAAEVAQLVSPPNLVVVRSSVLDVYITRYGLPVLPDGPATAKLELVVSYSLSGVVESLAVLHGKAAVGQRDALLLTFRDAKLSVMDWDASTHGLRTTSLHYFEGDPGLREGRQVFPQGPQGIADPSGRCAAVIMYKCQLALLPALEVDQLEMLVAAAAGGGGSGSFGSSSAAVGNSYIVNLAKLLGIREVRHAVFLHAYTEPVLLILHEPDPTWAGRYRQRKDTCALAALSINLRRKRHTLLWQAKGLPSDSYQLVPVPDKAGAMVLSTNLVMYYSQGSSHAVAVNSFALPGEAPPQLEINPYAAHPAAPAIALASEYAINVHPDVVPAVSRSAVFIPGLEVEVGGAQATWPAPNVCLLGLKTGQLLAVHIRFEGPVDSRVQVVETGSYPRASTLTTLSHDHLFLGSWSGDSMLLRYSPRRHGSSKYAAAAASAKRQKVNGGGGRATGGVQIGEGEEKDSEAEEEEAAAQKVKARGAYLDPARPLSSQKPSKLDFKVQDVLPGFGPIVDLIHTDTTAAVHSETVRGGPTVYACIGAGKTGAIAVLRQGLLPDLTLEVQLDAVQGVWALHHRSGDEGLDEWAGDEDPTAMQEDGQVQPALLLPPPSSATAATATTTAAADSAAAAAVEQHADIASAEAVAAAAAVASSPSAAGQAADAAAGVAGESASGAPTTAAAPDPSDHPLELPAPASAPQSNDTNSTIHLGDASQPSSVADPPASASDFTQATLPLLAEPKAHSTVADSAIVPVVNSGGGGEVATPSAPAASAAPALRYHAYVLISQGANRTRVMTQADELDEITTDCGYTVDQPTIAAGNLFNEALICQVCPSAVCLVDGREQMQLIGVEEFVSEDEATGPVHIVSASIADPWVLLQLSNGTAVLQLGDDMSMLLAIYPPASVVLQERPAAAATDQITACCLCRDECEWLARAEASQRAATNEALASARASAKAFAAAGPSAGADILAAAPHSPIADPVPEADPEPTAVATPQELPPIMTKAEVPEAAQVPMNLESDAQVAMAGASTAEAAALQTADEQGAGVDASIAAADAHDGAPDVKSETASVAQLDEVMENAEAEGVIEVAGVEFPADGSTEAGRVVSQHADADTDTATAAHGVKFEGRVGGGMTAMEVDDAEGGEAQAEDDQSAAPRHFLALTRQSGSLEIYALPSMRLLFQCSTLLSSPPLLLSGDVAAHSDEPAAGWIGGVVELRVESFKGAHPSGIPLCERPLLLALTTTGHLLAYQAFMQPTIHSTAITPSIDTRATTATPADAAACAGQLAWKAVPLDWLAHYPSAPPAGAKAAADGQQAGVLQGSDAGIVDSPQQARMSRFDNLAYVDPATDLPGPSYSGIFIAGARPVWLVACRGGIRQHGAAELDGPLNSLTSFHNINCPYGFITATTSGFKICQLPFRARLDTPWVSQRYPLKVVGGLTAPRKLAFYKEAGLLAALCCRTVPVRPRIEEEQGGEPHASAAYAVAAAAAKFREKEEVWELLLLDPTGCNIVWKSQLLQPGEQAISLKTVYLRDSATGNTLPMLAVGTAYPLGEEYPCLGRVLFYEVHKKVVDLGEGNLSTRWYAKQLYMREFPGPVTSVQDFKSQLLVAVGSKVEMLSWGNGSLTKTAFFDAPVLITALQQVKDYLLVGDVHHGILFVKYVEDKKSLVQMGKDFDCHDVTAAGIVVNEPKLLFLYADAGGALRQMQFNQKHQESWRGERLMPDGSLHTGQYITRMTSIKMPTPDGKKRHAMLIGTTAGSLAYVAPMWDAAAGARLAALQLLLPDAVEAPAGLNPRAFRRRHLRTPKALGGGESYSRPSLDGNGILDGQLLDRYWELPVAEQVRLAAAAGGTGGPAQSLADMQQLALVTAFT